jgi:hypothetical protein
MGRRRVKKSDALDAGGAQEIVAKDNIVVLDQEIGEHNCVLSQLK